MSHFTTPFTARKHGFRFLNRFDYSFKFELPLVGAVELGELVLGLCGGMCFVALDYYFADRPMPGGWAAEEHLERTVDVPSAARRHGGHKVKLA